MESPEAIRSIQATLKSGEAPGWKAQRRACPPGRPSNSEEESRHGRKAGVVALLCPDEDGRWSVVLMLRTQDGSPHSGQLSFPGGAEEPGDHGDLLTTALRECREEVGVAVHTSRVLGPLTPLFIPPSQFWVHPFVAWSPTTPAFLLQATEVAEVLLLPLDDLPTDDQPWPSQKVQVGGRIWETPGCEVGGHILWGATAMMVAELKDACDRAGFGPSFAAL